MLAFAVATSPDAENPLPDPAPFQRSLSGSRQVGSVGFFAQKVSPGVLGAVTVLCVVVTAPSVAVVVFVVVVVVVLSAALVVVSVVVTVVDPSALVTGADLVVLLVSDLVLSMQTVTPLTWPVSWVVELQEFAGTDPDAGLVAPPVHDWFVYE